MRGLKAQTVQLSQEEFLTKKTRARRVPGSKVCARRVSG